MRHALAMALAALMVCIGCEQKKAPQTGEPEPPVRTAGELEPLRPPAGRADEDVELAAAGMATPLPAGGTMIEAPTPVPITNVTPIGPVTPVPEASAPPIAAAPAAPVDGGATHVVQPGDTMWQIALRHYGNGQRYRDIMAANPGVNPTTMRIGQRLVLPPK